MQSKNKLLTRRVNKILPSREELRKVISKKKIRLYQGIDPTANKLHLGHTVGLRKLMNFANAGHEVILLFGTGTVLVGDPSLRDKGRKLITQEEINKNIKTWKDQVEPIIDFEKITIKQNGDWLTELTLKDIIKIGSNISAVQLFKRKSFTRRIEKGDTVWYHETMYPLLQGYDSVAMDVDLEVGGTDQEFNMLIGRELQKKMNDKEKFVLTVPMISGTDGKPMSKTAGNCVWLTDSASEMYGKIMSISDKQLPQYWELLTELPIKNKKELLASPLKSKKTLAFDIARQFHGEKKAKQAQEKFEKVIQKGQAPTTMNSLATSSGKQRLIDTLKKGNFKVSNSEIKRTIKQGGVELDGEKILNPIQEINLQGGEVIKFGKHNFKKVECI